MMNRKDKGKSLEMYLSDVLSSIDPKSRPTKASGACNEIADLFHEHFFAETKNWNCESITFKMKVWDKLCASIPIQSLKTPIYVNQVANGRKFVLIELKDFVRIAVDAYKEE